MKGGLEAGAVEVLKSEGEGRGGERSDTSKRFAHPLSKTFKTLLKSLDIALEKKCSPPSSMALATVVYHLLYMKNMEIS